MEEIIEKLSELEFLISEYRDENEELMVNWQKNDMSKVHSNISESLTLLGRE